MLIETQSKFAKFLAMDPVNSALGESASGNAHRELPKPSEIAVYIEMGIALAAALGLLAIWAWICFLKTPDWVASIHRLQDMF